MSCCNLSVFNNDQNLKYLHFSKTKKTKKKRFTPVQEGCSHFNRSHDQQCKQASASQYKLKTCFQMDRRAEPEWTDMRLQVELWRSAGSLVKRLEVIRKLPQFPDCGCV